MRIPFTPWSVFRTDIIDELEFQVADLQNAVRLAVQRNVEIRELRDKAARHADDLEKAHNRLATELQQLKREGIDPKFKAECEEHGIDPMARDAVDQLFEKIGSAATALAERAAGLSRENILAEDNERATEIKFRKAKDLNRNLRIGLKNGALSIKAMRSRFRLSNEAHQALADIEASFLEYAGVSAEDTMLELKWPVPDDIVAFLRKLSSMKVTRPPSKQDIKNEAQALVVIHG